MAMVEHRVCPPVVKPIGRASRVKLVPTRMWADGTPVPGTDWSVRYLDERGDFHAREFRSKNTAQRLVIELTAKPPTGGIERRPAEPSSRLPLAQRKAFAKLTMRGDVRTTIVKSRQRRTESLGLYLARARASQLRAR
jgi:hypothetical protein